ncbi:MAG TPA: hypothetical protein VKV30_06870 [Candidatus Angelobacter sp.]|nr:hypothetical protein [Candidatus Angelobacter sp.]
MHKRDEIIAAIKKCAERLGRAPSQAELRRASKISWYQVYKHFRGMRQAVRAAGLEPGPRGGALDVNALTLDWAGVVRKLGRLPSRAEYCEHGIHHAGTLHARIVWSQMAHKFVLLVREFHLEREWADVVKIVVGKFPLLETSIQQSALEDSIQQSALSIQSRNIVEEYPTETVSRELTRMDTNENREPQSAQRNTETGRPEFLPLIAVDNTDRQRSGMKLGKVVAAALAIEILMAAQRSTQQSALSIQPEESNWQLANSDWHDQNQDQNLEPQRTQRNTEESTVAADRRRDTQIEEVGRELAQVDGNQNPEPQRTQRNTEENTVAADARRETQIGEGRELAQIDANENLETQNLEPQTAQSNTKEMHALLDRNGAHGGQEPCGRPVVYGEPLGLAAMAHAPTNELGVLFLFGILAADLGFRVERLQAAFPDCEAKREVAPGKWELVFIELEIYSRNFKLHRHNPRGCHAIVCWKHNWPDCPEWLEVIELSKVVKGRSGDREIG